MSDHPLPEDDLPLDDLPRNDLSEGDLPGDEAVFAPPPITDENLTAAARTRALAVGPYLTRGVHRPRPGEGSEAERSPGARLDEIVGLAEAIDLDLVGSEIAPLAAIRPATFLGKGKTEEIGARCKAERIGLVVMDCALSPVQQRNLEKAFGCKVIDRTGLILEIFGRRARTKEGALQVELAHLAYQKSRLVRSWTHLERQRGGFGFLGGPGESQIETDRRLIGERMLKIERDLERVRRTRGLHREGRRRTPHPTLALVGYTNAGKSTLFNALTQAGVFAENLLFATLDPTSRALRLPHGGEAILIDTVGFVSDLPTQLVAAFRATLEDVTSADAVLHVRDVAHEDSEAQAADVRGILEGLGIETGEGGRVIEVWNKLDLLHEGARERLTNRASARGAEGPVLVSALTGEGLPALLARAEAAIGRGRDAIEVEVEAGDGAGLAWLHATAEVLSREDDPETGRVRVRVRVGPERREVVARRFRVLEADEAGASPRGA